MNKCKNNSRSCKKTIQNVVFLVSKLIGRGIEVAPAPAR